MSTRALYEIQSDAAKLALKITWAVQVTDPQDIDSAVLASYAEQLVEIAQRVAYHRTKTSEYGAKLAAALGNHREEDPR